MDRKRIALLVYVDLDPISGGNMHTEQNVVDVVHNRLEQTFGSYNPEVVLAPDLLQPNNR